MGKKNKLKDVDLGWKNFKNNVDLVFRKKKMSMFIGLFDDEEQIMKAAVHEFGSRAANIPERKWLSRYFDIHKKEIAKFYGGAIVKSLDPRRAFRQNNPVEMEDAGEKIRTHLIDWLSTDPLQPALSTKWLRRKKGAHQMVNEGDMLGI